MKDSASSGSPSGTRATARVGVPAAAPGIESHVSAGLVAETIGPSDDAFEREADRIADAVVRGGPLRAGWSAAASPDDAIQRTCVQCEEEEQIRRTPKPGGSMAEVAPAAPTPGAAKPAMDAAPDAGASPAAQPEPPAPEQFPALLVEDEGEPSRGQMRKSEFMAALRVGVCGAVDAGLRGSGRDSQGCPWIDHWLGYYEGRSASQIERSLRRYAPEAGGAASAREYMQAVTARVQRSAETWAQTGEITGTPDDMPGSPMAGGSLLGAFGGMFFKARPGGARYGDPLSVRAQLGAGQSLPGPVRTRMESAFGMGFDRVRLHNDANAARLSDRLNARAFTIGQHVAFGGGEFQPGTLAGDALIAHELAHVVQQGHGTGSDGPFYKGAQGGGGQASSAYEEDADVSAAGAVARLWTGAQGRLSDVGRHAMPRMRSGLQLQRCSKQKGAEEPKGGQKAKLSVLEERDASIKDASDRLRDVDIWASGQVKAQAVPDVKGVINLAPEQGANVAEAIKSLTRAESLYGLKEAELLPAKLDEIVGRAKEARQHAGSSDAQSDPDMRRLYHLQSQSAVNRAVESSDEATEMVRKLSQSLDVSQIAKSVDEIATTLNAVQAGKQNIDDAVDVVAKAAKQAKTQLRELRERFEKTPQAIGRVLFVLRSFLALNDPTHVTPPTSADIKTFAGTLDNAADDFSTVFAEGKPTQGFAVFVAYAEVLDRQLAERQKMAKAGVDAHAPVPTQGDAESYFTSLKAKPNDEVFAAYTAYAQAYFYHRVVDKFGDMNVAGVADLYQRPLSILGLRPLVCTGYALLGSHLLAKAGATLKTFIVAVRATPDDIVSDRVDAGHALAAMNRKGKDFFVSNHLIVATEEGGIGEEAVAWEHKKSPLHKATGKPIPTANARLADKLADLAAAIRKQRSRPASTKKASPKR